jgi:hypothetical protein
MMCRLGFALLKVCGPGRNFCYNFFRDGAKKPQSNSMHIEENAIFLTIFPITCIDAFELV